MMLHIILIQTLAAWWIYFAVMLFSINLVFSSYLGTKEEGGISLEVVMRVVAINYPVFVSSFQPEPNPASVLV